MNDLEAARGGDADAFSRLTEPHRRELLAHCYRMLGGLADAEDAVQESLVAAWRGLGGFEGRSSLRSWLYRIATNSCLRILRTAPPRMLSFDRDDAADPSADLEAVVDDDRWIEPWSHAGDPAGRAARRESIELAYIAALQLLPATQRAVLLLRDVLAFSAAETAELLDTSVASVTSALQRARAAITEKRPSRADHAVIDRTIERRVVEQFVTAFVAGDVPRLVALLTDDVRFTMPPLPAWFDGRHDVGRFFAERVLATPWRVIPVDDVNARPAAMGYQRGEDGVYRRGALMVFHVDGESLGWIATFLDPVLLDRWELPRELDLTP